jgi:type II secretory pathway component PulF
VNLNELREVNKLLGPLLFIGYAVLVIFILLNMFVAIVTKAYTKARACAHTLRMRA